MEVEDMDVRCQQTQPAPYRRRCPAQTVLYEVLQGHLETVLAAQDDAGSAIPAHAERALRRYLECGILAHGFARARCGECGHDFLIAFSCKGRGVCPSCNTRRMAETAAHLVDHVLPPVPLRQWVLSLPKRLRWHLHHQPGALDTALRILLDAIERDLCARCVGAHAAARGGAVAFIHRFGSALNVHTHFHVCAMDGMFEPDGESVRFHAAPAPGTDDIEAVQAAVRRRILRAFQRRGWLERADRLEMEQWQHGGGFSLDASVGIAGRDRRGRERLLRYCARPPFAGERLEWIDAHRVRYRSPKPRPDGSGELILSPPQLIERVAALVPPPRRHRLRYYGVLAPNAPLRTAVTALAPEQGASVCAPDLDRDREVLHAAVDGTGPAQAGTGKARYRWAVLLARIFEAFPLTCPHCSGEMRIIAFVTDPASILAHIGEPTHPPPLAPARDPPAWETDASEGMSLRGEPAGIDPLAQPEPEYIFDQRIAW